jgi:hypothetical protein
MQPHDVALDEAEPLVTSAVAAGLSEEEILRRFRATTTVALPRPRKILTRTPRRHFVIHAPERREHQPRRTRRIARTSGSRGDPSRRSDEPDPPPLAAHPSGGAW